MCEDRDVEIAFDSSQGAIHMSDQNTASVRCLESERRFTDRADDSHSRRDTGLVSFVIAETGDNSTPQLAQGRNRKGRNKIPRKNDEFTSRTIEDLNRSLNMVQVVVAVGEDTNQHQSNPVRLPNKLAVRGKTYDRDTQLNKGHPIRVLILAAPEKAR